MTPTLLYIGYYMSEQLFDEIVKHKINNMSTARQSLEYGLLKEFSQINDFNIKAISYVPASKKIKIPSESRIGQLSISHIPIIKNRLTSYLKGAWRFWHYLWKEIPKGSAVVMYAVNPIFMFPLSIAKTAKKLTLTTICSEVPKYRRYDKSLAMRFKKSIQTFFNNRFDKYILLTEPMKEVVAVKNKPYMVMEGIAAELPDKPSDSQRKNIVMYAGGLHPDNNLRLLIEACNRSSMVEECWICGSGPQEKDLASLIADNQRIKLLGRRSHEEVKNLEKQVKILINLRDSGNPLTRYSFPSKIIEYLASGAQVISTRLAGIPAEYFDYLHTIDDDRLTADNLADLFNEILSLPEQELQQRASKSLKFLKENKSAEIQSKRIIEFACQN